MHNRRVTNAIKNSIALKIAHASHTPKALFTDIDDTFIDRAGRPAALQAARDVREHTAKNNMSLVLVSGLAFDAIQARIVTGEIPEPEAIMAAVGTDIWLRQPNGKWLHDDFYTAKLQTTGYDQANVRLKATQFIAAHPGHELQLDPHGFGAHKVSLNFMGDGAVVAQLADAARATFPNFKIVTCQEIHYNATLSPGAGALKFCLDIVPATKADALQYMLDALKIQAGFKAGDSGNDADMLLNPDSLLPILVGGYKPELLAAVAPCIANKSGAPFYELQNGQRMYVETNPNLVAAQSILHAIQTA